MVRFDAGVDDEWACAAPVFLVNEGASAVDVGGGVGAGEGDPEPVAEAAGGELSVVDERQQGEAVETVLGRQCVAEAADGGVGAVDGRTERRGLDGEDPGKDDPGRAEAVEEVEVGRDFRFEAAPRWAGGGDDEFGALVEAVAGVVEGVDGGAGLEVEVAGPVDALEQVAEELVDVVDVEFGGVVAGDDEQVFGEAHLALAEDGIGLGQQFHGASGRGVGDVALAADSQKQGMNAGGVDGVDGVDAGQDSRDERAGQLVDQGAEGGVFLGGAADGGEGPDGAVAVVDALDGHDRKVVDEGVVAEVVAEGAFGLGAGRVDVADQGEVGLGGDQGQTVAGADQGDAVAGQSAGEGEFGQAFGQGHDGGNGEAGRAADGDGDRKRIAATNGRGVVDADAAVDLVMEADFAVGQVVVTGQLDTVHAEVGVAKSGPVGVFGVNLGECDERAAVARPGDELGKLAERRLVGEDGAGANPAGQKGEGGAGQAEEPQGSAES